MEEKTKEKAKEKVLNELDAKIKGGILIGFIPFIFCTIVGGIVALFADDITHFVRGALFGLAPLAVLFIYTIPDIETKHRLLKKPEAWEKIDLSSYEEEEDV